MVYGIVIVVTVFLVLAVARYYPSSPYEQTDSSATAKTEPIVLPREAAIMSAEEMRQETEEVVAALISDYSDSVVPRKIAAEFAQSTYRYEEAKSQWQTALELEPQSIDAQTGLAKVAIELGHPEEAVARLDGLRSQAPSNSELSLQLARGLQQTGKLDEAASVAMAALKRFPFNGGLLETTAEIESQRGELESAKDLCERGIKMNPSSGPLHFILSNVNRRLGNTELADKHLKISRELRPETKTGSDEFEKHYDRSLRQIVSYTLARTAEYYIDQGDAEQATKVALRAVEIFPQGGDTYRILSKILYRQQRFEDAYQAERRLIVVEPNNPVNFVNLSKLAFMAGDPAGGREALMAAYKRMPGSPTIATALAAFYLEDGDLESARKLAKESIQLQPTVQAYQVLSAACAGLGDPQGKSEADLNAVRLMKSSQVMDAASN